MVKFLEIAPTQVAATVATGKAQGAATFLIGTGSIKKAARVDKVNVHQAPGRRGEDRALVPTDVAVTPEKA